MRSETLERWQHEHTFGQETMRAGERRTWLVIALTAAMMVVEIVAGLSFGSMALLADGLHMASHTVALGIAAGAYVYPRRHASDARFTFGTGKVSSLAGFTGALLLALFALLMAWESIERLVNPLTIAFDDAILVAVVGFVVNGFCAVMLNVEHEHPHVHHDYNLRSAENRSSGRESPGRFRREAW